MVIMIIWKPNLPWWANIVLIVGLILTILVLFDGVRAALNNKKRLFGTELRNRVASILVERLKAGKQTDPQDFTIITAVVSYGLGIQLVYILLMKSVFAGILDKALEIIDSRNLASTNILASIEDLKESVNSMRPPRKGDINWVRTRMFIRPATFPASNPEEYLGLGAWACVSWIAAIYHSPYWAIAGILFFLWIARNVAEMYPQSRNDFHDILIQSDVLVADIESNILTRASRQLRLVWN